MYAACQLEYRESRALVLVGEHFNSDFWECFTNTRKLGGRSNLDGYCQSIGDSSASLDGNTGYDWRCVKANRQHVAISMAAACQRQYRDSQALDRLGVYFNPNSWECWG